VLLTVPEEVIINGQTSVKLAARIINARSVRCSSSQSHNPAHLIVLLAGIINGQNYKPVGAGNSSLSILTNSTCSRHSLTWKS
jgi:hypothetical protein